MATKRSLTQSSLSNHSAQKSVWFQVLSILAIIPLLIGVLLILTAVTGVRVWGTPWEQVMMGGLYVLVSFVLSNLLQKEWKLTLGWLLLGVAFWLGMNWAALQIKIGAAALGGLSVALIAGEFLRRRRQYLADRDGKKSFGRRAGRK